MSWFTLPTEKIEQLAREFEIENPDGLRRAVATAMDAMAEARVKDQPEYDDRNADSLDKLAGLLAQVIQLLQEPRNGYRLTAWLRQHWEILRVPDLLDQLQIFQSAATEAHRKRVPPRGPLAPRDARAASAVLVRYWVSLGRRFTQNQRWASGERGRPEPVTLGERFVYKVIQSFAPDATNRLRTIAREFTRKPSIQTETP